jgi:transcriptional regulator with PAS, ATPase and Fis domain
VDLSLADQRQGQESEDAMERQTPSSSATASTPTEHAAASTQRSARLPTDWRNWFPEILGNSLALRHTLESAAKVASSSGTVLITGESGTGKELIASAIHRLSSRSSARMYTLNCSAIPENLLESELFGHTRGAFTGAEKAREGLLKEANGGTLFLDEVGEMPLSIQAKLLRVLQQKEFTPLGTNTTIKTDVRIVAATNVDLKEAVIAKKFRADLYYRLNVLPVHIPPLRERFDDLEALVSNFLKEANRIHSRSNPCVIATRVFGLMRGYNWPGNIRELQNVVERMVVMKAGGVIQAENLPPEILGGRLRQAPSEDVIGAAPLASGTATTNFNLGGDSVQSILSQSGFSMPKYITNLENALILAALDKTDGNKNQAAKLLGMNRTTLVEKIKKRKIAPLNPPSREL